MNDGSLGANFYCYMKVDDSDTCRDQGFTFAGFTQNYRPAHSGWVSEGNYFRLTSRTAYYIDYSRDSAGSNGAEIWHYSKIAYASSTLQSNREQYIGDVTALAGTYPSDGRHTDGYYYVLKTE